MEKFDNLVRFEGEDGEGFEMVILKEFEIKDKKYAVLMGIKEECDDECECECHEHDHDCECEHDCECDHDKELFLLEITKDKDGKEVFKDIEDEEEYKRIVEEAERIIFEDEE